MIIFFWPLFLKIDIEMSYFDMSVINTIVPHEVLLQFVILKKIHHTDQNDIVEMRQFSSAE